MVESYLCDQSERYWRCYGSEDWNWGCSERVGEVEGWERREVYEQVFQVEWERGMETQLPVSLTLSYPFREKSKLMGCDCSTDRLPQGDKSVQREAVRKFVYDSDPEPSSSTSTSASTSAPSSTTTSSTLPPSATTTAPPPTTSTL